MTIVYANGCSLTEGSELGNIKFNYDEKKHGSPNTSRIYNTQTPDHVEHMMTHTYAYKFKEMLGYEGYQNDAIGGGSNSRIVRQSIIGVNKLLRRYKPEDIFAVIGWTTIDRFELPYGMSYQPFVPGFVKHDSFPSDFVKMAKLAETWLSTNLYHCLYQHFTELHTLKSYFESKGIKYVFVYGLGNHFRSAFHRPDVTAAADSPDLLALYEGLFPGNWVFHGRLDCESLPMPVYMEDYSRYSFYSFCTDNNYPQGNGRHPLEEAHEAWAKTIFNTLSDRRYI